VLCVCFYAREGAPVVVVLFNVAVLSDYDGGPDTIVAQTAPFTLLTKILPHFIIVLCRKVLVAEW
jgi:hypothetical protein